MLMFSEFFILFLFTPAAIVAALTLVIFRFRPPGRSARGFPVVLNPTKIEKPPTDGGTA